MYDGIWGYSAILSMCALSCVFFALSQMSVVLALVNVLGTIGVQYGLRTTLSIQVHNQINHSSNFCLLLIGLVYI